MTDAKKVKRGDILSLTYYVKSADKFRENKLLVTDLYRPNNSFYVQGQGLVETARSADEFSSTKSVTKTKLAELLTESGDKPFTVMFIKADGTERILRGRLLSVETLLGRSNVDDLDVQSGPRLRQIDHRTIQYIIIDGVKYLLKK